MNPGLFDPKFSAYFPASFQRKKCSRTIIDHKFLQVDVALVQAGFSWQLFSSIFKIYF